MAWTQNDLDVLEAAIAMGALEVKYQDRDVTYRSLEEMLKIRDLMRAELGETSGRGKRIYAEHNRGY